MVKFFSDEKSFMICFFRECNQQVIHHHISAVFNNVKCNSVQAIRYNVQYPERQQ